MLSAQPLLWPLLAAMTRRHGFTHCTGDWKLYGNRSGGARCPNSDDMLTYGRKRFVVSPAKQRRSNCMVRAASH